MVQTSYRRFVLSRTTTSSHPSIHFCTVLSFDETPERASTCKDKINSQRGHVAYTPRRSARITRSHSLPSGGKFLGLTILLLSPPKLHVPCKLPRIAPTPHLRPNRGNVSASNDVTIIGEVAQR
jgi:hypothetical protein